jgi:hypothetical protein
LSTETKQQESKRFFSWVKDKWKISNLNSERESGRVGEWEFLFFYEQTGYNEGALRIKD